MLEPVLKAYRLIDPDTARVEYRMDVKVSFVEDGYCPVPTAYLAHMMADRIREYVNRSMTYEEVQTVFINPDAVCPICFRKYKDGNVDQHKIEELLYDLLQEPEIESVLESDHEKIVADYTKRFVELCCQNADIKPF